ncbi:hypothetical protein BSL78_19292 [Apostichopus japonicus]|uniref:Uncharacterized protein n=1 Tax=Stichopus japonicus TaxID=307972 RepID=A0A2G8K764_STIJA|nr:hypothetical protein BSL78_19292 [Apostichopus japonicus]
MSRLTDRDKDGFFEEILCKFRDDDIGLFCRKDPVVINIGERLWTKSKLKKDKAGEVRKSVMTSMRRLATLYMTFLEQQLEYGPIKEIEKNLADMFLRDNYTHLEHAILKYTMNGEGKSMADLKYGLKTALYYLIKKSCQIIQGTFLIGNEDDKATELDKFMGVFELNHNYLFGDASYAMHKNRNEKLRKPESLPQEEDICKVREYTMSRMSSMMAETYSVFDSHVYIELRDLLVSRLTLFNARRGGEPCRLRQEEWKDAENGAWIDQKDVEKLDDELDKVLAKDLKIAYQTGKGNKHLVPILLPKDTIEPLRMITDQENRALAGVNTANPYVFPCTQDSLYHVSGWYAVHSVCEKLDLQRGDLLTATKNRHRISTIYASMEIPQTERRFFYEHMGHSEQTNKNIYQAPLALMEIVKVGKSLNQIDGATGLQISESSPSASTDVSQESGAVGKSSSQSSMDQEKQCATGLHISESSPSASTDVSQESGAVGKSSSQSSMDQEKQYAAIEDDLSMYESDASADPPVVREVVQYSESSSSESSTKLKTQCTHSVRGAGLKRKRKKYIHWKADEEEEIRTQFRKYILGEAEKKLPSRKAIESYLLQESCNIKYDWWTVRTKIQNDKVKRERLVQLRALNMNM